MEEMIDMLFKELAKQTERAVRAEQLEKDLRANIEAARNDAEFWKNSYFTQCQIKTTERGERE